MVLFCITLTKMGTSEINFMWVAFYFFFLYIILKFKWSDIFWCMSIFYCYLKFIIQLYNFIEIDIIYWYNLCWEFEFDGRGWKFYLKSIGASSRDSYIDCNIIFVTTLVTAVFFLFIFWVDKFEDLPTNGK